jgi:hypothetical protein
MSETHDILIHVIIFFYEVDLSSNNLNEFMNFENQPAT